MGMVNTTSTVEEYRGETYRLERRAIVSLTSPRDRIVWCWEVLSGPAQGEFGGKQPTKREARRWARHAIREIGPERLAQMEQAHADGRHAGRHPEDRVYWRNGGCSGCIAAYDEHGLPVVTA